MNPVTVARIHLALCHVPAITLVCGWAWLAFGLWRQSRDIQRAALVTLAVAGLLSIPLYMSGESAVGMVKGLPGFSDAFLERHEALAGVALAGHLVLGVAAIAGWFQSRGRALLRWLGISLLGAGVVVIGLVLWTASLGGQVRHSEIRTYDARTE